jgi:endo-1,4-beta-D-glucanase Y
VLTKTAFRILASAGLVVVALIYTVWKLNTGDSGVFRPQLADRFFEGYSEQSGRIVRRDQGSDTVSEGQAYGLLIALAQGDAERFRRVWSWTEENLRRTDGLLPWRWDGRIVDEQPATDADVDAAFALLIAGERFGDRTYVDEGRRMARAIMAEETEVIDGKRYLVAGPWARRRSIINPSYISPDAFEMFARATGDERWHEVLGTGLDAIAQLTSGGELPPDWARVDAARAVAIGGPDSQDSPARYGSDAPRTLVRLGGSCNERARRIAADLKGAATSDADETNDPLRLVAAAAAAHASGDMAKRDDLIGKLWEESGTTYYGSAWAALGPAFIEERFVRCR